LEAPAVLKILFLDSETRSRLDISVGTDRYTRAAECRIVTYAFVTEPAKIWLPYCQQIPRDLKDALDDPEFLILAHNAVFDRLILARALKLVTSVARWRCTMAGASAHGLPGSLESLGKVCGLSDDEGKLIDDKTLIDTFCSIQPATGKFVEPEDAPEAWQRFCNYAIRDTEALRTIFNRMPQSNYAGVNLRSWMLDQLVNERGFGFDVPLAQAASDFLDKAREASRKVMRDNTENQIGSATQAKRLLGYIRNRYNIDIESLRAGDVRDYLESDDLDPILRTVLEERLEAGKSAGTKFKRGLVLAGPENRIRHWCRWSGAGRTGRHAARGYQPHNMARPAITVRRPPGHQRAGRIELEPVRASTIDDVIIPGIYNQAALSNPLIYGGPFEAVAIAVRHGIIAAPGNELVVADFKNVETVITAWVAGETSVLTAFRDLFDNPKDKSKDPYRIIAGRMLGKRPEDVNESERQMGKVAILAFGFGGGVAAMVNMAIAYQMDLEPLAAIVLPTATPEQLSKANQSWERAFLKGEDFELERDVYMACDVLKQAYRTANPAINQLRYDLNTAILEAVSSKDGTVYRVGKVSVWCNASFLVIELPSGRRLLYASPILKQEEVEDPLGGKKWTARYITYLTVRGRSWRRERAWSGLFVENIVQAIANDVLRAAMLRVHDDTLTVPDIVAYLNTLEPYARTALCLHVHDEIGLDVPRGSYPEERLLRVLKTLEKWMEGLPIAADLWTNPRYGKR
jgi:DNA polymerase bacteriophage-type